MSFDARLESDQDDQAAFEAFVDATEDDFQSQVPRADARETRRSSPKSLKAKENAEVDDEDLDDLEGDEDLEDDLDELEDDAEGDDGLEDDLEDGEEGDEGDDGESPVDSIEALAEHFEVEPDQVLNNLMVQDHEGYGLPIGEALEAWREGETSLEDRRQELETTYAQRRDAATEKINAQAKQLMSLASGMHQVLLADYSPEALSAAQHEDPIRYGELVQRKVRMEEMIRQAIAAGDQIGQARQAEASEDIDQLATRELAKLVRVKREWRDPKVRARGMQRAKQYLTKTAKFTPKEIENITDHRILVMIDDAVLGHKVRSGGAQKEVGKLQKRGLRRPSTGLKRSSRREQANPRNKARAGAMAKLRKTGDARDAAALLMEHIED